MELVEAVTVLQNEEDGCDQAFEFIIRSFKNRIFTICYRMVSNRDDAMDLSQEIFLSVFLNIHNLNDKRKFGSWLHSITIRKCINFLNNKKVNYPVDHFSIKSTNENNPRETEDVVNLILERVEVIYRVVLILKYIEGRTVKEISEILNLSESAVKMRLKRAKEKVVQLGEI